MWSRIRELHRFILKNRLRGPALVLTGMLVLLSAQLIWWVVFFQMNYRSTDELQEELDRVVLALANGEVSALKGLHFLERKEGRWIIREDVSERRRAEHVRKLWMLISETIFVLGVISYGSLRILRSINRERRLVHERNVFINSVTHELKTPMTSILLNLQTLIKRKLPPSQQNELLEESILHIKRLEDQVNNILLSGQFARKHRSGEIAIPGIPENGESADLSELIRRYLEAGRIAFKREQVTVTAELEDSIRVRIRAELFEKVISNLVQNAIQYSRQKPVIHIRLATETANGSGGRKWSNRNKNMALLSIADNGIGIPEEELDNVFIPFYRLQNDNRPVRGSGVGLYIVQEIVQSAGGTVRALRNPSGIGTQFELRFPLATDEGDR